MKTDEASPPTDAELLDAIQTGRISLSDIMLDRSRGRKEDWWWFNHLGVMDGRHQDRGWRQGRNLRECLTELLRRTPSS